MSGFRKRVLFVTPPGYGHLFPLVPLAWAFRSAGHSVKVATAGVSVSLAARAGLSPVNVAPGVDLKALFLRYRGDYRHAFHQPNNSDTWSEWKDETPTIFTELGDVMLDDLITVVEAWHPNLIIYTPYAAAAAIAASKTAIPSVFLGIFLPYTPCAMFSGTYARMRVICERRNVARIDPPLRWIDLAPQSLRIAPADGLLMRYIPYNGADLGGGTLGGDAWPSRRIVVTLGTVVPQAEGLGVLRWILEAASGVDAEFVVTHGAADTAGSGQLPHNVKAIGWAGHDTLFSGSCAVIHHGGAATMFTALDAGLPQLVLPRGAEQFYNASALARRGVALVPSEDETNAATLRRLLEDESLRSAARQVSEEIVGMPPPSDIVPDLLRLSQ